MLRVCAGTRICMWSQEINMRHLLYFVRQGLPDPGADGFDLARLGGQKNPSNPPPHLLSAETQLASTPTPPPISSRDQTQVLKLRGQHFSD